MAFYADIQFLQYYNFRCKILYNHPVADLVDLARTSAQTSGVALISSKVS